MKNLKLKVKMQMLIGFVCLGLVFMGIMSLVSMSKINKASTEIASEWLPNIIYTQDINSLLTDYRLYEYSHIISTDRADMKQLEESMDEMSDDITKKLESYPVDGAKDQEIVQRAKETFHTYLTYHNKMISLSRINNTKEAIRIADGEALTLLDDCIAVFEELTDFNKTGAEQASLDGDSLYYNLVIATAVSVVAIIVVVVALSLFIARAIGKPIEEMVDAAGQMSKGNLDAEIKYQSKDEIGELAASMNSLMDTLKSIIKDVGYLMKEMSEGNFNVTTNISESYVGDFEDVIMSIRDIRISLGDAFSQIGQAADQVSSGSDQVSNGAQALSQGSTEQASSIQQLTATINEVSERVVKNAENAALAKTTTNEAKQGVDVGNHKMQELIGAMANISNTSNEIEKIIKTIDDIAFQTNILALNAAVEAARAGEAGKGFAVVADEVRNLASKCAEAAQNITGLIETSISAVESGKTIADETAESLSGIVDGTQKSTDLINEIAVASNDQSTAIMQISQGMEQISAVVETNSATAEESAAASEELSGQADVLKELLMRFKFSNESVEEQEVEQ